MMQTDLTTHGDGQRTQVGADPLDYVLRYAASDYDCYVQGRYIGSRPTLSKAIEAVRYEQEKVARHPQACPTMDTTVAVYQEELRAIGVRLHDLATQLVTYPVGSVLISAQLTMAHIRIAHALKNIQDAERSLTQARHAPDLAAPLDAAA
jgi:hypothetical protein